jgi:hypothetical protein
MENFFNAVKFVFFLIPVSLGVYILYQLIGMVQKSSKYKEGKGKVIERTNTLNNFTSAQTFSGADGNSGIAFDENKKSICIVKNINTFTKSYIYSYKQLIASQIVEDGDVITKTVSSHMGMGVAPNVGFALGTSTGKSQNLVSHIDLLITVDDYEHSTFPIRFLDKPSYKKSDTYKNALSEVRHWHGLVELLIKKADSERNKQNTSELNTPSIAEELKKLAELRDSGVLTESEFSAQKEKLLKK